MDWLQSLLWDPSSVAHIVLLYAFVVAAGDKDIRSIFGRHICFVCRHPNGTFRLHSRYTHPTFHP